MTTRRTTHAMFRLIAAALIAVLPGVSSAAPGDDAGDDARLRVTAMSYNIRFATANDGDNHWDKRRDLALDVFERADADVVGMQEMLGSQLEEITARFPRYAAIGVGRDDGRTAGEYSAILYRHDRFAVDQSGTFWLSGTPSVIASITWGNAVTRICTWARLVEHASGKAFYVYNTHYDHVSQPSREKSSFLITEHIARRDHNDPVVLMGDFNAGETNPAITHFTDRSEGSTGPGLVDPFRVLHPDATEVGTFNAFRGRRDGQKIDFILVEPETKVLEAAIDDHSEDGRYPSDHFPVTATVVLRPSAD